MRWRNGQNGMVTCLLACCCLLARFKGEGCSNIYTYIHIYIYIYISFNTHPSPQLRVAPPCVFRVRAKGTAWCIHVAEGAKLDQNGLKMGSKHLFMHPQWSRVTFGKTWS